MARRKARPRDDGGQKTENEGRCGECPGDWLASAGGAALRSAMVMFREGGLKRDRNTVGAALCCPTTVAVRRSSSHHPTRDVAPRRVRVCADGTTEREKEHVEESREKKKKKKKKQKRRLRS